MNLNSIILSSQYVILLVLIPLSVTWAKPIKLEVSPSQNLIAANKQQTVYLKIGLTGNSIEKNDRSAVNIGLVLDKSSSMQGIKLTRAKEAAIIAIERLGSQDIASVIAYNGYVEVILPANKVIDKKDFSFAIRSIYPSGSTALFAGVSKGADEVRKFISRNQTNRVILLSDGQANVGPRTAHELGMLGDALSREGISVTTIGLGLGYNEDLMQALAIHSGGNHAFAENANDLTRIFQNEFNDVLSVVASDVRLQIQCMPGIKPLRVLGRQAYINNTTVDVEFNQIYSKQEKYIILEVQIPAISAGEQLQIATVVAHYNNLQNRSKNKLSNPVKILVSNDKDKILKSVNYDVMEATIEFLSAQHNERAIALRDQGKIKEAEKVLNDSANFIQTHAEQYKSKRLESLAQKQISRASKLEGRNWNLTRKKLRRDIHQLETQQSW